MKTRMMTLCENSRALALFADARREHGWDAIEVESDAIRVVEEPVDGDPTPEVAPGAETTDDGTQMATFRLALAVREPTSGEADAHVAGVDGDPIHNPSPVEVRVHDCARFRAHSVSSDDAKERIREASPEIVLHDTGDVHLCGVGVDATDTEFDPDAVSRIITDGDDIEFHDEETPFQITVDHPDSGLTYELTYLNEYLGPAN